MKNYYDRSDYFEENDAWTTLSAIRYYNRAVCFGIHYDDSFDRSNLLYMVNSFQMGNADSSLHSTYNIYDNDFNIDTGGCAKRSSTAEPFKITFKGNVIVRKILLWTCKTCRKLNNLYSFI